MQPGRRQKHSASHEMGEFTDLLQQLILKIVEPFMDLGEVAIGNVQDPTGSGAPNVVDKNKHDVWTTWVDGLNGRSIQGRLLAPAGVIWRLPTTGATAHMIRGRKQNAPGGPLIVADGGDGSAAVVPGWDDNTNLDANNSGVLLPEGWHIESQNDRVRLVGNSKGTKCVLELQAGGSIVMTPATGETVQVGGNAYSLPQWDTYATAFKSLCSTVSGLTPPTTLATVLTWCTGVQNAFTALNTAMAAANNYKSQIAKNG